MHTQSLRNRHVGGALLASALGASMFGGTAHAKAAADAASAGPDIIVTGQRPDDANPNADKDAPYKIDRSDNPRFTEKTRDTPKTQVLIPKEVIEDIGATTFREVVRTTPGVTLGTGEGGNAFGDRIFIRGFEARNDIYIDGLRDPGVVSREIFAVEQIEIVKGPSSSFGGRGTTGGLVSLQSKRPLEKDFVIASAGVGTDEFIRGTVDANYASDGGVSVRVNGLYHTQDIPGRDYVFSDRYGIAGAVAWEPAPGFEVLADYYHFRLDGMSDFGHPFDSATGEPYEIDRDNFYGAVGRDFLENGSDIGTLRLNWDGGPGPFAVRGLLRYGETFNRYVVSAPRAPRAVSANPAQNAADLAAGFQPGQLVVDTGAPQRNATNQYLSGLVDFTARFATGPVEHALVFGTEFANEEITNRRFAFPELVEDANGDRINTPGGFTFDLFDPNPVLGFDIPALVDDTSPPTVNTVDSLSFFALDTIDLTPQLRATLGLRYDTFAIDSRGSGRGGPFARSADVDFWNYQASLLYKPSEPLSFYASFATSSNPSGEQLDATSSSYGGLGEGEDVLEPERNTSYELGAKWEVGNLLLTAAAFRIEKTNAREQVAPGIFELSGEQRAQGVELGVSGNLTPRLALFGGYTYLDAVVTESVTSPAQNGQKLANVPEHTASLLATYALADGFEVGAQVSYRDEIFGGSLVPNAGKVDDYIRLDFVARARLARGLVLRVNVLNATDEVYYDAIYRSGAPFAYIAPGRSAFATLEATF